MTCASVFIQMRKVGVKSTPMTVSSAPETMPKARFVWMARETFSKSPAPKYLEMATPAPIDVPMKRLVSSMMSVPDELTAAKAFVPRYFPTMKASAVL